MRNLLRRTSYVAAAVVGALSTLMVASEASAITMPNTVRVQSSLRACETNACPADVRPVLVNTRVTDFCALGSADLIYTGPSDGRGGFVPRANLSDRSQFTPCDNSGLGAVTNQRVTLRACASSNCTSFGAVGQSIPVSGFCLLGDPAAPWVLVYSPIAHRGGFAPASALQGNLPRTSCNG